MIEEQYDANSFKVRRPMLSNSRIVKDMYIQTDVPDNYTCPSCNVCLVIPEGHAVTCDECGLHIKVSKGEFFIAGELNSDIEDIIA